jgi:hypothetical protein
VPQLSLRVTRRKRRPSSILNIAQKIDPHLTASAARTGLRGDMYRRRSSRQLPLTREFRNEHEYSAVLSIDPNERPRRTMAVQ